METGSSPEAMGWGTDRSYSADVPLQMWAPLALRKGSLLRRSLVLAGLVYGLAGTSSVVGFAAQRSGWLAAVAFGALGLVAATCYLAVLGVERRRGGTVLLLVTVAVAVAYNLEVPMAGLGWAFALAAAAPFALPLVAMAVVVTVDAASTVAVLAASGQEPWPAIGIGLGVQLTGAFYLAVQQLLLARRQADAAAEARAGAAVLAERQRMAREIHDLLAHTLSAQVVQLEGARMLMERGDRPEQALRQVVGAMQLARDGLDETKRALAALRGDDLRVVDRLAALAADFRATGPGGCELDALGEPALSSEAGWAIVRSAQEALTNVRKHAVGADVVMRLGHSDAWCDLEVVDSGGSRGALADTGAGFGLTGMRERAELIGGAVEAGPCGDGFRVSLRVPTA